jgi:hypothetical protein
MTSCKYRFFLCKKDLQYPGSIIFATDCPTQLAGYIRDNIKKEELDNYATFVTSWVPMEVWIGNAIPSESPKKEF